MRAVNYYTERVEIAFPHDNAEHVVSLLPYLQHPTSAVGVVYEIWNEAVLEEEARWLVQTAGEKVDLVHEGIMHHADRLDGASKEVTLLAEDDDIHVTIVAELLSPAVVMHDAKIDKSPTFAGQLNKWSNRGTTLEGGDSSSDVEAVLLLTRKKNLGAGGTNFGCRGSGSTSTRLWRQAYHSCNQFYPVKAPFGGYQVWVEGPTKGDFDFYSYVWELGYIRTGHGFNGIRDWVDENPESESSWVTRTASAQVPAGAEGIFAVQRDFEDILSEEENGLAWWHGLRAIGSSDIERRCPSVQPNDSADPVKLDGQKRYRYLQGFDPELYILAYTMIADVSGVGTAKLVASAALSIFAPAQLEAMPEVTDVMSAVPTVDSVLTASAELQSLVSAVPDVGPVMTATPELEAVMTGRPALPEE